MYLKPKNGGDAHRILLLFSAAAPTVPVPVAAFINGTFSAQHVAFLPHHQVRSSGRYGTVTFGAGVSFSGINSRDILHEPVSVPVALNGWRRVKNP